MIVVFPALKRAVFEKLGITKLRELIDFTYRSSKGEIAALVPVIEDCANKGDPQAQEILRLHSLQSGFADSML